MGEIESRPPPRLEGTWSTRFLPPPLKPQTEMADISICGRQGTPQKVLGASSSHKPEGFRMGSLLSF